MKYVRIAFIFSLSLIIFAGCEKEQVQPESLSIEDGALKGAKVKKGKDHFVPFKASFDLSAYFQNYGPIKQVPHQIDFQEDWPFGGTVKGMHVEIRGNGNATHLGKTTFKITQWWTRQHPHAPKPETGFFSFGQGKITFTAANGDLLYATYWGWADHTWDDDGVEILTHGTFIGGTGRFEGAQGKFEWDGLFMSDFTPIPPNNPDGLTPTPTFMDIKFGEGQVKVSGTIMY